MTRDELRFALQRVLPGATVSEDNDGQLIVYTDLQDNEGEIGHFYPPGTTYEFEE
jgi:hypothetical protein